MVLRFALSLDTQLKIRKFTSTREFAQHKRTHKKVKKEKFECKKCGRKFSRKCDHSRHLRNWHPQPARRDDASGGTRCNERDAPSRHRRLPPPTHPPRKDVDANDCGGENFSLRDKVSHARRRKIDSEKIGLEKTDPKKKGSEEIDSEEIKSKEISSDDCGENFSWRDHIVSMHLMSEQSGEGGDEEGIFECGECGETFTARNPLNVHMKQHIGKEEEEEYRCNTCGRKFTSSSTLSHHQYTHTGKEKEYRCKTCHKEFASISTLSRHLHTHTGVKKFECALCHKRFMRKDKFNMHIETHRRVKILVCGVGRCAANFTLRAELNKHKAIIHGKT
ncbi:hypothetical protein Pmani_011472 [Petrolisthes manimaculis]|uniref:C2H2-type domain-containing protein n=1 Tax=Petrolisthes manimaculis TaxID=1843537 RepID=A0AAE1Q2Y1_9EUCA|nr:hypothetical protein Pmani_011472 [Petrolisthes manimaculis]